MRAFEKRLDVSFFSSFGCEQCELDAALGAVRVHDEIVIEVVDYFQVRVRCFPFPFVQFVERGGDDELAQVARVVLKRSLKRDDDDDFDATRQKESERERERERERESKRYSHKTLTRLAVLPKSASYNARPRPSTTQNAATPATIILTKDFKDEK